MAKSQKPVKSKAVSSEEDAKLQGLLASLEKAHGKGVIMMMDGPPTVRNYKYQVPSGSIGLDIALGPMKRLPSGEWQTGSIHGAITECFGPEGSGKTTLMLTRIANYQQMGLRCAMLDMEHALDPLYARKLGVDMTKLAWSQPNNGEQCLQIAVALIRSGLYNFVGIDSVAALVPKAELEGDAGDSFMGLQARLMSQSLRQIVPLLGQGVNCEVFFTNQIRMKLGRVFGNPETTPGGNALKYAAHFRLDVRRFKAVTAGGGETEDEANAQIVGHRMRVKVIKNKVSPPFRVAEFSLIYGAGIDTVEELFDLCLLNGIITGQGWYTLEEGLKFQGKANAVEHMRGNRLLLYRLYDRLMVKNMAGLGLNPDGTAMPGISMAGMPTHHSSFEPPTAEELAEMAGQEIPEDIAAAA